MAPDHSRQYSLISFRILRCLSLIFFPSIIAITFSNITYDIAKSNGKVCYTLLICRAPVCQLLKEVHRQKNDCCCQNQSSNIKIHITFPFLNIFSNARHCFLKISPVNSTAFSVKFSQRITNEHLLNRCPFVILFFTFI